MLRYMLASPDPDTFFTAFFQGGATLVAIIAGIIGARFVAAHGDVQGLRDRLGRLQIDEQSLQKKAQRTATSVNRRRAERRACGAQFLDDYVSTRDLQLVEGKVGSMDPRIREHFRQSVQRIDDFLPQCEELLTLWGDRALSVGTLRLDDAPRGNSFNGSVYAHAVLERAKQQRAFSPEHDRKFANLKEEVRKRDTARHRALRSEIEQAIERESALTVELGTKSGQTDGLQRELSILEAGEGYRLGLRVLGLVAGLVMIPPVGLLLFRPIAWGLRWPALLVALLFALGIAVMLRYLFVYSSFIQGRTSLPSAAIALVFPWSSSRSGRCSRNARLPRGSAR